MENLENKEIYIVYQLGYNGFELMEILGVFQHLEEAKQFYLKEIQENIEYFDFDYDKECKNIECEQLKECNEIMTRLFKGGYKENWDNYLEIHIEKQIIK